MGAPDGKFPLQFALILVNDDLSRNIAPHAIQFGSEEGNGRLERYLGVRSVRIRGHGNRCVALSYGGN